MIIGAGRSLLNSELVAGKPQTAVTSWIERACDPRTEDADVVGILPELVAVINLQNTGPTEASRAVRKKLKYGDVKRQMRAIQVLESLVLNCGERFQTQFANERLVDRIKIMAGDPQTDASVKKRIMIMLASWQRTFADDPRMSLVAGLYKACGGGQAQAARAAKEAYQKEQDRLAREEMERRDRMAAEKLQKMEQKLKEKEDKLRAKERKNQPQRRQFVFEQEKPLILQSVAVASQSANNLVNTLQHVNREQESVTTDPKVQEYLAKTKEARKKVVRYTQLVPDHDTQGEFLGMLLNTNEQVMAALQLYDRMSKPVELDSDDEADIKRLTERGKAQVGTTDVQSTDDLADTASVSDDASIRARMEAASLYDGRLGEVDRLQARQRLAVMRHNSGYGGGLGGYGSDLAGLDFNAAASTSNAALPPPIEPHHTYQSSSSRGAGSSGARGGGVVAQSGSGALSDYSDYDSSEGEDDFASPRPSAPATFGAGGGGATEAQRSYDQYLPAGERGGLAQRGLLEGGDDEVDPFADPDEVATPGIHEKRMTWAEI